ncbi:MAG: xanthine dehydrogenase family protein subunit M [Gemmatimonadota bacterium]
MPATVAEACAALADDPAGTIPVAGGTDLLVHWPERLEARDKTWLDLWHLEELRGLHLTDDTLQLGALTTYWDLLRDSGVRSAFPLLAAAARLVGAIQIQSRGTWAGNIANASPAADGVPALMALDAVVVLASVRGRREVPLDALYRGYKQLDRHPDELIAAIRLPRREYTIQRFEKVGARRAQAIAKVGLAVARSDAGWRVVASSVAPTVRRCRSIERWLEAEPRDTHAFRAAVAADIAPIDDLRSTASYRERVFREVLLGMLPEAGITPAGGDTPGSG